MLLNHLKRDYIIAITWLLLSFAMAYYTHRADFIPLVSVFFAQFLLYIYVLKTVTADKILFWIAVSVFLRAIWLFSEPNLSDDVYRFIWDGRLWLEGINPFAQTPDYYMQPAHQVAGLTPDLYTRLNSPHYFTIYPTVCQAVFYIAVRIFPTNILGAIFVIKFFLFLCEISSLKCLYDILLKLKLPLKNLLLYALNPLIVCELVGNVHFEAAMLFFLLAAIYALLQHKLSLSALLFSLSIVSKLFPLAFLPLFIPLLGWKKGIKYILMTLGVAMILFLPLLWNEIPHIAASLRLYFVTFEYNASLYYLLRWFGFQWKGYNMISLLGPVLAMTVLGFIFILFIKRLKSQPTLIIFLRDNLWIHTVFLICATTVHPWYLTLSLGLACFTSYCYIYLWSGMIFLSYYNYNGGYFQENLVIVCLEYAILAVFFGIEIHKKAIHK